MTEDEARQLTLNVNKWFAGKWSKNNRKRFVIIAKGEKAELFSPTFELAIEGIREVCDYLDKNNIPDFRPAQRRTDRIVMLAEKISKLLEKEPLPVTEILKRHSGVIKEVDSLMDLLRDYFHIGKKAIPTGTKRNLSARKQKRWKPEEIKEAKERYRKISIKYIEADKEKTTEQIYSEVAKEMGYMKEYPKTQNPGAALQKAVIRYDKNEAKKRGHPFGR